MVFQEFLKIAWQFHMCSQSILIRSAPSIPSPLNLSLLLPQWPPQFLMLLLLLLLLTTINYYYGFLRQSLLAVLPWLDLLWRPVWPWLHRDTAALVSWVQGLKVCVYLALFLNLWSPLSASSMFMSVGQPAKAWPTSQGPQEILLPLSQQPCIARSSSSRCGTWGAPPSSTHGFSLTQVFL